MTGRANARTIASSCHDVVIIGGGTCGSVLASRLSEDPERSVCLVEAGARVSDPMIDDPAQWPALQGREFDWGYQTLPQPGTAGRRHNWPRGRLLGGSSCINAMAHVRGHSADFETWTELGCTGWRYQNLLPYYIRSECSSIDNDMHGRDGPVHLTIPTRPHPITDAFRKAGIECGLAATAEHNGGRMAGPTLNTLTIKDGRRQTTADAYLTDTVLMRDNLTVLTESRVLGLGMKGGAGTNDQRCESAVLQQPDGQTRTLCAGDQVILCAGAIETPALLMRSGMGAAAQLEPLGIRVVLELPGVGKNLQDHLLAGGNVYRAKRPVAPSNYQHSESLTYIHRGAPSGAPEIVVACVTAPVTTELFSPPPVGSAYTLMYGFTHPQSRGVVKLESADPVVPPLIDPQYLAAETDCDAYRDALRWARKLGSSEALSEWRLDEFLPRRSDLASPASLDRFLARAAYTHHHPAGTCRMGVDDDAVVDSTLRVRGTENLFVMDASVMPSLTTGPINATLIAMAERASDLFKSTTPLAHAA